MIFFRLILLMSLMAAPLLADTGYFPSGSPVMPNGMDLDRDFVLNELGVDDLACDEQGETETDNASLENLDGAIDVADEVQIYVAVGGGSEGTGTDNSTCGTPGSPCATVDYAVTTRYNGSLKATYDNGFICVNGTQSVQLSIDQAYDGDSGTVTQTAASRTNSNQRWDHDYPQNPLVIMGWDTDNDNEYPPYDTDDEFVIDTGDSGIQCTPSTCPEKLEIAHVNFDRNGMTSSENGGWIQQNSGTMCADCGDHWYFHDLEAFRINDDQCQHSGNVAFSFQNRFDHIKVRRGHFKVGGGYVWRGGKAGVYNLYAENYFEFRVIGGNNSQTDNNGNSCSSAGGSEDTGLAIMRTWYNEPSEAHYEYIDNTFTVDKTYGTNGYDNGLGGGSEIVVGVILGGWDEWNFSGNHLQDVRGLHPLLVLDDGIGVDQASNNHYMHNNSASATHADAFWDGSIFGIAGTGGGSGSGSNNVRDEFTGVWELKDSCADWLTADADIAQGVGMEMSSTADLAAATMEVSGVQFAANFSGTRGVFWDNMNSGCSDCVPGTFIFKDNTFENENGADDDFMFKSNNHNWTSAWDSGNGNNDYYGGEWTNNGTTYSTLAAWEALSGITETGSTSGVNPTVSCSVLADGTDYAAGGGGGGGGGGATVKYFNLLQGDD